MNSYLIREDNNGNFTLYRMTPFSNFAPMNIHEVFWASTLLDLTILVAA